MPGTEGTKFAISRSVWKPLLALFGGTGARSYVTVNDEGVVARFGYYRIAIPRNQIAAVEHARRPWYWGLGLRSNLRDTLGMIGSYQGLVHITLKEPLPATLLKIPLQVTNFYVSVEDPDGLIAALQAKP